MAQVLSFVVVGANDVPLYQADLTSRRDDTSAKEVYRHHFVLHAALDSVDDAMWTTKELHLKTVDRFSNQYVSAFVTPSNVRLLLLHDGRGDDSVKGFFGEVYEIYVRLGMNPFHTSATKIESKDFDRKVVAAARRHLL